jgi:fructose-bisphosphate aldolase class II
MVKINVGTALNVAFTGAVCAYLVGDDRVDPRRYLVPAREQMAAVVTRLLGGHAGRDR